MNYHQNQIHRIGSRIVNGTSGSVLWIDSSLTFAQNNAAFFWDATNARLGIGNAAPADKLHVKGSVAATPILQLEGIAAQSGNYLECISSTPATLMAINSAGRIRVNTTSLTGAINASPLTTGGSAYFMSYVNSAWGGVNNTTGLGIRMNSTISDAALTVGAVTHNRITATANNLSNSSIGLEVLSYAAEDATLGGTTSVTSLAFYARNTGATAMFEVVAMKGLAENVGTGAVTNAYGVYTQANFLAGCGNVTNYYGFYSTGILANASGTTNAYSLYAAALTKQGAGVITNLYGLYIETPISGGTLNYALYAAGGSSIHVGKMSFGGTTTPAAMIHIQGAGTAAAALRVASGAAPTSPATGDTWNDSTTNLLEFRHSSGTNVSLIESSDFAPMLLLMGG